MKKLIIREVIEEIDPDFCDHVIEKAAFIFGIEKAQKLRACIQCGTCVGGCPSSRRTAWRTKRIFRLAQLGMKKETLDNEDLWLCTTCYTCQERCIRNIPTTDLVRIIRNIAFENNYATKPHLFVCNLLFRFGHAVPVNDDIKKLRKELGLSEVPHTTHMFPEALEEVNKLCEVSGFKEKVKENEKSNEEKEKGE
ncbi:MAG: CoB--CoM heterodisulfide reductase subunit C [Candidatus Lokiarchaeota archaeon]|nr:CoB--CoM heterodisulfide reductase subunit C [Candidatus Lokiarchaeota archaeon]